MQKHILVISDVIRQKYCINDDYVDQKEVVHLKIRKGICCLAQSGRLLVSNSPKTHCITPSFQGTICLVACCNRVTSLQDSKVIIKSHHVSLGIS